MRLCGSEPNSLWTHWWAGHWWRSWSVVLLFSNMASSSSIYRVNFSILIASCASNQLGFNIYKYIHIQTRTNEISWMWPKPDHHDSTPHWKPQKPCGYKRHIGVGNNRLSGSLTRKKQVSFIPMRISVFCTWYKCMIISSEHYSVQPTGDKQESVYLSNGKTDCPFLNVKQIT